VRQGSRWKLHRPPFLGSASSLGTLAVPRLATTTSARRRGDRAAALADLDRELREDEAGAAEGLRGVVAGGVGRGMGLLGLGFSHGRPWAAFARPNGSNNVQLDSLTHINMHALYVLFKTAPKTLGAS
jgi:hypothetical protein